MENLYNFVCKWGNYNVKGVSKSEKKYPRPQQSYNLSGCNLCDWVLHPTIMGRLL